MAHELFLVRGKQKQNITPLIGNLSWSSNIDALGVELTFDYAYNDSKYLKPYDIVKIGDHVTLLNNGKVVGRFIVVDESVSGRSGKSYTAFDYAWYLNKSGVIIQFKKLAASKAIQKLLDKQGVKHKITPIKTSITQIYKGEAVSDIISDILEQATEETRTKYRMEMDGATVVVRKASDLIIKPQIRLTSNTPLFNITETINSPSVQRSIQDMKNKVIVMSNKSESLKTYTTLSDKNNIAKYGQLVEVVDLDDKNAAQARNTAKNKLAELNKVTETISFEMLGHDSVRAGRTLVIKEPITGLKGNYLIKSASHTVSGGIHKVSVEVEKS